MTTGDTGQLPDGDRLATVSDAAADPAAVLADDAGRVRRAVRWLLSVAASNAEGAVYGAIMIGVLLAAEDAKRETYGETIGAAVLVAALYWMTALYTYTLGARLSKPEPLDPRLIRRGVMHELPVLEGAVTPLAVLLIAWALGASLTSGLRVATVATAVSIVVLELAAGYRVEAHGRTMWVRAGAGALVGLAVIGVKVLLHA